MGLNKFSISARNLKISLRVKVTISVTILIALTALTMGSFFLNRQKQIIQQNLREKGLALANNAAYNAEYGVLSGNSLILANLMEGIMRQSDVAYCIVQNLSGDILASKGLNKRLLNSAQYKQASEKAMNIYKSEIQLVSIQEDRDYPEIKFIDIAGYRNYIAGSVDYYDVTVPVMTTNTRGNNSEETIIFSEENRTEKIGVVRIGMSLANANMMVGKTKLILILITLSIILISSLLATILIKIALLPIQILAEATQRVSKGDFNYKVKVNTKDELEDLAYAFNKMVRDLQDSTVSVKALRMEQKRFSDIANNSGDWIWEMDSEGRYVYTNRVVGKILGYEPEEILGRYFYDFFIPGEQEEMKKTMFDNFSKKEILRNFLNRNLHKNGHVVILEISAIPLVADNGELIGYRGVDRDVTDRDRVEKEREDMLKKLKERQELLERQKQEVEDSRRAIKNAAEDIKESRDVLEYQKLSLEATNKELDDFTYIVSHDLKEPLRSIDAYSKFVMDDYKDKIGEEGKHYLERVRANAERMKKLIEDLLEISRLKRRGGTIEEVETKELVDEIKMRLEYLIKQKNAEITVKDNLPKIFCDRVRLTEVFLNLISNAIKYDDKPKPIIEIGYGDKGDMHEFYVKDNGIGIKEEYFDKIFEIFQRLGRKEDVEGTGAGLTIVKKIVQLHKGEIWLKSKIGEGTVFYFTIPKEKSVILGKKLIGEILVERKLVAEEELKKALDEQQRSGLNKGGQNDRRT
jgi:PAS domain S-box-containing protein